jgi:ABC-type bacteriocin/lantibiotic exporter with double-glycine peptidase domain
MTGRKVPEYQNTCFKAVEAWVNLTSHTLSSVQSVKLLGISKKMERAIQGKREQEISVSQKFRFTNCLALTSCQALSRMLLIRTYMLSYYAALSPMVLSPLITFIAYSVVSLASHGAPFSVTKAVTSLSILSLMNTPARRLLFAIPFGLQAVGSFNRIEKFLRLDENPELLVSSTHNSEKAPEPGAEQDMGPTNPSQCSQHVPAIHVKSAAFGWEADAAPVVSIEDIDFARGSFTDITGPIGCGKSTLLKGLLLETPYVRGTVQVSTGDVAYCGQTPWIHEGTIRANIVGESEFDASWYNKVISSCELDFDLSRMADGDASMVGSRGLSISGGQRQRIVCAISEAKPRTYALPCVTDEL